VEVRNDRNFGQFPNELLTEPTRAGISFTVSKRLLMAAVKLIVAYPLQSTTHGRRASEEVHNEEHVPLAGAKLNGKAKLVLTKIIESHQGPPVFYPSQKCTLPPSPH
jgi:hypothetical protein